VRLRDLAGRLAPVDRRGPADAEVRAVTHDSRQVGPGTLFAAIPGTQVDGHRFIPQAVAAGAAAVLLRDWPEQPWPEHVVGWRVPDPRRALALSASALADDPGLEMTTIGLTGTNGKTTTACILAAILRAAGQKAATLGTTGIEWDGPGGRVAHTATHTTPEGPALFGWLGRMRDDGVEALALELSSHALEQGRAAGLQLDVAAWSNLTRDHLDYHGTEEAYEAAKALIFSEWLARWGKPGCTAVVNVDDPVVARHATDWPHTLRVSARPDGAADLAPLAAPRFSIDGCRGDVRTPAGVLPLRSRLLGPHNLANSLLAAGCALAVGVDLAAIAAGLAQTTGAPGRLERVERRDGRGPLVLVDYAHTPRAIDHVLSALRPLVTGRLVIVFGCGGDRDRGKRPSMGTAAAAADLAILTSDNPRTEDPEAILDAVEPALVAAGAGYLRITDRAQAIVAAVGAAGDDDVILLAGKGHEPYQEIHGVRHPFDDRVQAKKALETLA
jgi:UDP-N-acetylmuramoyl-L-alanyl-D-glutamate--2,6-diaminopimelate ligase